MKRPWEVWSAFGICLVAVALAVGWLSLRALDSEKSEVAARQQATLEENVRLALWRLDTALAVVLAQENARPFEAYLPNGMALFAGNNPNWDNTLNPSLSPTPASFIQLYFHAAAGGQFESPQSPGAIGPGQAADEPETEHARAHRQRLDALKKLISVGELASHLPFPAYANGPTFVQLDNNNNSLTPPEQLPGDQRLQQQARGVNEFRARSQYVSQNAVINNGNTSNYSQAVGAPFAPTGPLAPRIGILMPVVAGDNLLLARQATVGRQVFVQGAWLDWTNIREDLRQRIADLLPDATFAIHREDSTEPGHLLASLPIHLDPGRPPVYPATGLSPVRLSLIVTWGAMVLAAAAVATLLRGVVTLSERRADFVSAVTHELRTPLTTFRMYAEMLAEGMVLDEGRRRQYLDTLRIEADRLTHLVENVLAYARLERGGLGNRIQRVTGEQLLSAATTRLGDRASQAELELSIEVDPAATSTYVMADPSAVEQILFNLVDNACKYAARGNPPTIELRVVVVDVGFVLRIRDHGPGLSAADQRRLFQPFRKSADQAATSAPGVGLGLSLSRRLARDMRGDLKFDATETRGAAFELRLPLASTRRVTTDSLSEA